MIYLLNLNTSLLFISYQLPFHSSHFSLSAHVKANEYVLRQAREQWEGCTIGEDECNVDGVDIEGNHDYDPHEAYSVWVGNASTVVPVQSGIGREKGNNYSRDGSDGGIDNNGDAHRDIDTNNRHRDIDEVIGTDTSRHQNNKMSYVIRVLAYNRPKSLLRLLLSLVQADYAGYNVSLAVLVDGPREGEVL